MQCPGLYPLGAEPHTHRPLGRSERVTLSLCSPMRRPRGRAAAARGSAVQGQSGAADGQVSGGKKCPAFFPLSPFPSPLAHLPLEMAASLHRAWGGGSFRDRHAQSAGGAGTSGTAGGPLQPHPPMQPHPPSEGKGGGGLLSRFMGGGRGRGGRAVVPTSASEGGALSGPAAGQSPVTSPAQGQGPRGNLMSVSSIKGFEEEGGSPPTASSPATSPVPKPVVRRNNW